MTRFSIIALWALLSVPVHAQSVPIPQGRFAPLFGLDQGQTAFTVRPFSLDRQPVSESAFARFLESNPGWTRAKVSPSLCDEGYLSDSAGSVTYAGAPQTRVSWFAAQAYCEWRGGRLPTTLEWEYVAAADEKLRNAAATPGFVKRILAWYGRPFRRQDLLAPGSPPNVYDVAQLHGLIWEWTLDFNATFVTGDARQDGDRLSAMFCGNGATGSARREDYAAFMRYALRSSLTARSTLANLGFRCAYDEKKELAP